MENRQPSDLHPIHRQIGQAAMRPAARRPDATNRTLWYACFGTSKAPITVKLVQPNGQTTAEPFVRGIASVLSFHKTPEQLFLGAKVDLQPPADAILTKLQSYPQLSHFGVVRQGIAENPASINKKTNEKHGNRWHVGEGVFALRAEEVRCLHLPPAEAKLLRPYHDLCDVGRYSIADTPSLYLIYSNRHTCPDIANAFPTISRHLGRFRVIMEARRETREGSNRWWHLHWPRDEAIWRSSKIIAVQMAARPSFVPASRPVYVPFSINVFVPDGNTSEHPNYITGLLNSRLLWKWYQHHAKRRGVGLEINGNVLGRTPIRAIDFSDSNDKSRHGRMVSLVKQTIDLHKHLAVAKSPTDKTAIQRQIDATDRQIDQLVYDLYGLTDDEIRTVEEATDV